MKKMLHTKALINKSNMDEEDGVINNIIGSTNVTDRMGDVIEQSGWDLKNFLKNPVILYGHNQREETLPIGKAIKVWVEGKGTKAAKLMFKVKFDLQDSFAAEIYRKIKEGYLNTVSVGFIPSEWEELDPNNWFGGLKYISQELLELSVVPIPANPQALMPLKAFAEKEGKVGSISTMKELFPQIEDNRFKKMMKESKEVAVEKIKEAKENEIVNEVRAIEEFDEDSFRVLALKKDEKEYVSIIGKLKGTDAYVEQSRRFNKDAWTEEEVTKMEAVEAPAKEEETTEEVEETEEETTEEETTEDEEEKELEAPEDNEADVEVVEEETVEEEKTEQTEEEVIKGMIATVEKAGKVLSSKNETKVREAVGLLEGVLAELSKAEMEDEKSSNVIVHKDLGTLPESESWDVQGEVAKANVEQLKLMSAFHNAEEPENKSGYKLIHHKATDGNKTVFRGVASAMAQLLGAKGGVEMTDEEKKGVYDHLVEHYKEFNKEAPTFKMVEDQILKGLEEEVQAVALDREDKHLTRLVKRVLENQTKKAPNNDAQALEIISLALSKVAEMKGGENT